MADKSSGLNYLFFIQFRKDFKGNLLALDGKRKTIVAGKEEGKRVGERYCGLSRVGFFLGEILFNWVSLGFRVSC